MIDSMNEWMIEQTMTDFLFTLEWVQDRVQKMKHAPSWDSLYKNNYFKNIFLKS